MGAKAKDAKTGLKPNKESVIYYSYTLQSSVTARSHSLRLYFGCAPV